MNLKEYIVTIPNFPKEGVMFRDVTSLLDDKDTLKESIDSLIKVIGKTKFDKVVGPESRGFIFGMPVAYALNKSFVPIRKKGKLPREVISQEYDLEYGTSTLEMHKDSIKKGDKVIIIDDLLATGGTMEAMTKMIESLGGEVVKICVLIELPDLNGRKLLSKYDVESIIEFEGD